jgi:hypothetical protein
MRLNLLKAIKSTHRNPINRGLHLTGLSLYIIGLASIATYFLDNGSNNLSYAINGLILFPVALGLFLTGHKIEGNMRALTLIIVMKYLSSKLKWSFKSIRIFSKCLFKY